MFALFAGSAVFALLRGPVSRRLALSILSAGFLWLQSKDLGNIAVLAAFVLSGYVAAMVLQRWPSKLLRAIYIIGLIIAFVVLKRYAFLTLIPGDYLLTQALDLIGLSFIFFRQIHFVIDVSQGEIRRLDLWAYLLYQFNPFTLLAGPIQRYQRFEEDWQTLTPLPNDGHEMRRAFLRILIGVIKVAFIGDFCFWLAFNAPESWGVGADVARFYLFPAYVYFNFAGYCDIVIAGAALFGMRVPENFDRPYLARNMIDYWTRWHRTLSFWIRDYVFNPTYMAVARRWTSLAPHLAFICYFWALFLAGVWHGATWNFVIFGLLNGAGVSAAKLWENIIIQRAGRKGLKAYLASTPILWLARLGTFHFACLTMIFLREESTYVLLYRFQQVVDAVKTLISN